MSELHASISVEVPEEAIPDLLRRYLASLETNMRGEKTLRLAVAVALIAVEREVLLTAEHVRESDGCEIVDVSWHSESGPYPPFAGTLRACREDADRSRLELAGSYHPPLGVVGAAFDSVVGHRFAQEAVHDFLASLKAALERFYAADTAKRRGPSTAA